MSPILVLLSLAAASCFAIGLVLTQAGLRSASPLVGATISVPMSALVFALLSPWLIDFSGWTAMAVLLFVAAGPFFPASVTLLTFAANRRIGPNLTGALGNLSPLFAVSFAVLLLGEAPTWLQLAGVVTICLGAALMLSRRNTALQAIPLWALALPLAAAFIRGVVQPVVKLGLEDWPAPFAAVTIGYLVSALVILGFARLRPAAPPPKTVSAYGWFVPVGLANGAAVLLLYMALARGPVTVVAPLVACYPALTLLLSRLTTGDQRMSAPAVWGILMTVIGVALLLI